MIHSKAALVFSLVGHVFGACRDLLATNWSLADPEGLTLFCDAPIKGIEQVKLAYGNTNVNGETNSSISMLVNFAMPSKWKTTDVTVSWTKVGPAFPPCAEGTITKICTCGSQNPAICDVGSTCAPAKSTCSTPLPPCANGLVRNVCRCGTNPTSCKVGEICDIATSKCSVPPPCPLSPKPAPGICSCGKSTCNQNQMCDPTTSTCSIPPPTCPNGTVIKVCSCGTNPTSCKVGEICDIATSKCSVPPPAKCPLSHKPNPGPGICSCGTTTCNQGQICDPTTSTCSSPPPKCPNGNVTKVCSCGAENPVTCTAGQTCDTATSTCSSSDCGFKNFLEKFGELSQFW